MNAQKQSVTINVELFGRETPVEISFAELNECNVNTKRGRGRMVPPLPQGGN